MNKKIHGYVMAIIGFTLLFFNTFSYIFDWEYRNAAFTILGLVFITLGIKRVREV